MTEGTRAPTAGTNSKTKNQASALIVDDDVNMLFSIDFLLRSQGFHTVCAADGEAALDALEESVPDFVLLDITMPKMDGYEVCQRIKNNPAWAGVKIIFVSAKSHEIEIEKGLGLGADGYQTKPFSSADLLAKIDAVLAGAIGGNSARTLRAQGEISSAALRPGFTHDASSRLRDMNGRPDV